MSEKTRLPEIDLGDRDPTGINSHIRICFDEVLAEPDGVTSIDTVWTTSYKCFQCGKLTCYRLLTSLCGVFIALAWGCDFAVTAFLHIWCYTPCMRKLAICVGCVQRIHGTIINCWVTPIVEACGMVFRNVVLRMKSDTSLMQI